MDELFEKIGSKLTLSQKIERSIENAIREKKLPIGSRLPTEKELCESFGVSRTALREALRRLSARGLISVRKGSGMVVTGINIKDAISTLNLYYDLKFDRDLIKQIIELRSIFEPEISRLAARRRTDIDLAELLKSLNEFRECDPDNTQMEADLDNKFHLIIAKATHNPIVQISMEPIYSLLPRMRNLFYANIEGEKEITLRFHPDLYEALKEQDGEKAFVTSEKNLMRTNDIYTSFLDQAF
jgi:GntR family transcriptional regulator, transcriptional repressor for pyruvate dehydrogenase complex